MIIAASKSKSARLTYVVSVIVATWAVLGVYWGGFLADASPKDVTATSVISLVPTAATVPVPSSFCSEGQLEPAPADQAERDQILSILKTGVRRAEDDLGAFDAWFEVVANSDDPDRQTFDLGTRRTRWARKGEKTRYELVPVDPQSTPPASYGVQAVYDGQTSRYYLPDKQAGGVDINPYVRITKAEEAWLTLSTFRERPMSEALDLPGVAYEGHQTICDTGCLKVSLREPPEGSSDDYVIREIWFSPDHGYRAKRIKHTHYESGRITAYTVVEVGDFLNIRDGVWFPMNGRKGGFRIDESGQTSLRHAMGWSLQSFSDSVDDAVFALAFPPGTELWTHVGIAPTVVAPDVIIPE